MPLALSHITGEPAGFARQDQRSSAAGVPPKAAQREPVLASPENMAPIVETKTSGRVNQAGARDLSLPNSRPRLLAALFARAC